ncbi:hypothetical protein RSOLAG22IIIB_05464 [Rhizoctonia solani]|uniref:Delta-endotoxin CytB n=1 Tax=Rhizoctonia solani TaxID=456999 RepID=A0A0K6G6Z1_9AGAM|nr:hypothetical protein RSOLAG22IIIB_05464 [Rhizoctonia solani]
MSDDKPVFDEYGTLPGQLIDPAKQVMKFTGYFLDVQSQRFNWSAYKDAIDARPDTNLVIEQYENNTIAQQDNTVEIMVDKIGDFLKRIAGAVFDRDAMVERVTNAFTSLKEQEENGFAWYEKKGNNTSFTYRILFAVPNEHIKEDFYALVSTIKLEADILDKSTWFGLVKTSRHNFSAEVDTMKLACNENFQAGPKPPMF